MLFKLFAFQELSPEEPLYVMEYFLIMLSLHHGVVIKILDVRANSHITKSLGI